MSSLILVHNLYFIESGGFQHVSGWEERTEKKLENNLGESNR